MYTPSAFAVRDPELIHDLMERHSFATLIAVDGVQPVATHLPLLLDRNVGRYGRLTGHMARANPLWQTAADRKVLAIFHGPHAYISAGWMEDRNVLPTWNYVSVHASGMFRVENDPQRTAEHVGQLVDHHESQMPKPWSLDSTDADFRANMLDAIIAFSIDIERLEGKQKLNQNHSTARREKVMAGLAARNQPGDHEVAALMQALLDSSTNPG